jgi:FtsP/CotA-like multicopper oxidase with cupredoxin domain
VLTLSDWYHQEVIPLANIYLDPTQNPDGAEPVPYSALMNDRQNVKLNVKPGKTYYIRIINQAAFSQSYLHFDQHKMTIIEIDGIYTKHKEVDSLYLAVGQRYGILLKTKHTTAKNYAALAMLDSTKFDNVHSRRTASWWHLHRTIKRSGSGTRPRERRAARSRAIWGGFSVWHSRRTANWWCLHPKGARSSSTEAVAKQHNFDTLT